MSRRSSVAASVALATLLSAGTASAVQFDSQASRRQLQDDLTSQRAVAIARERRLAGEREEQLLADLDRRDERLRLLVRDVRRSQTELSQARVEVAALVIERTKLVEAIAERDRGYNVEVAEFRRQVASLTDSNSPELLQALQAFADGDRVSAFPVIDAIVRAENRAAERATALRSAARLREVGSLALIMIDRGEKTTADVMRIWEEAQSIDPSHHWGWIQLSRLLFFSGLLDRSRDAAERSLAVAATDPEIESSLMDLGDIALQQRDVAAARQLIERALAISEQRTRSDPTNAAIQRNVSINLMKLGDVLEFSGDLRGAGVRFERAVTLTEQLARTANESNAYRDWTVALERQGHVLVRLGDLSAGRDRFERSLAVRQQLLQANPTSTTLKRDLSVSLMSLAEIYHSNGDSARAIQYLEQALAIRQELLQRDPSNAFAMHDVILSRADLALVLTENNDLPGARAHLEQALQLAERRIQSAGNSAVAVADVGLILGRLAATLVKSGNFNAARSYVERSLQLTRERALTTPGDAETEWHLSLTLDQLGEILEELGDRVAARQRYEEALAIQERLHSDNRATTATLWLGRLDIRMELVRLLTAMNDRAKAAEHAREAVALAEQFENPAGNSVARALMVASQALEPTASQEALNRALNLLRGNADEANTYGFVLILMGRFDEANDHFRKLLAATPTTHPDYGIYLGNLANAQLLSGNVDDAVALITKGLALRPDFATLVRQDLNEFRRRGLAGGGFERIEALIGTR